MRLRESVAGDFDELVGTIKAAALTGDMTAAGLLLNRLVPAIKPVQMPVTAPSVAKAGTLVEKAEAIIDAVAAGQLAPADGKLLLEGLAAVARIVETEDLARRIAALEGKPREQT